MGEKGTKSTVQGEDLALDLRTKLAPIGDITLKKMFGRNGIFHDGSVIGMTTAKGEVYLKADETLRANFARSGSVKHSKMPYYSISPEILGNAKKLMDRAQRSIASGN